MVVDERWADVGTDGADGKEERRVGHEQFAH